MKHTKKRVFEIYVKYSARFVSIPYYPLTTLLIKDLFTKVLSKEATQDTRIHKMTNIVQSIVFEERNHIKPNKSINDDELLFVFCFSLCFLFSLEE